ncbi:MAG: hypothetical protein ACRD3J_12600 [Thermoanaerobaculia bacterium]
MKKTGIAVLALLMAATVAVANDHGGPPAGATGGPGEHGPEGDGGGYLNVAPDGTVIIARRAANSTEATPVAELVAIRNGAIAWTSTLPSPRTEFELSDSTVIEIIDATASGATTPSTTLKALSVSTGAQAWTLTLTGRVNDLTPFNGGTYAVVVIPATTSGGTSTRSLVAISSSGVVLSTVAF